jgi:two-component system, OmpR family, sensor histidine kinase BaeS
MAKRKSLSILWKLTLAFMLVAIISAAFVAVFIRFTTSDRLFSLIIEQQRNDLQTILSNYYTTNQSWDGVAVKWQSWIDETASKNNPAPEPPPADSGANNNGSGNNTSGNNASKNSSNNGSGTNTSNSSGASNNSGQQQNNGGFRERRRLFGLADEKGVVIVPIEPFFVKGDILTADVMERATPIEVNKVRVGMILTAPLEPSLKPEENAFLQRTNQALLMAALIAMLIALIVGVLLALTLITPLQKLTQAVQKITSGELGQQVDVKGGDEIGVLAETFNQMSQEVARVNHLRRQMTADIAHDLRTPLTVIAGYIESMQDGVLQPTPERLALIYTEIERLQDLVGDLRTLSLADAGELSLHLQVISPRYLLDRAAAPYQHRAEQQQVTLRVEMEQDTDPIRVDEARMMQVFSNLLSNALRYTSEGDEIVLSAVQKDKFVELSVRDNGEGILEENLQHIFERFYRADPSRYSEAGETTGLGLAIVKALVEIQKGKIRAESQVGQGTAIFIRFETVSQDEITASEEE